MNLPQNKFLLENLDFLALNCIEFMTEVNIKCMDCKIELLFQGRCKKNANGVAFKNGFGRLLYKDSTNLFYMGHFHEDEIYGSNIKIFHNQKDNVMMRIESQEEEKLDEITGSFKMFWPNGNQAFEGGLLNGLKNGVCQKFTEDGKVSCVKQYSQGFPENKVCDNLVCYQEELMLDSFFKR